MRTGEPATITVLPSRSAAAAMRRWGVRVANGLDKLEQATASDDTSPLRHLQGRPAGGYVLRESIGMESLPNPVLTNRIEGSADDIPLSNPGEPPLIFDDEAGVDGFARSPFDETTAEPGGGAARDSAFADVGTVHSDDLRPTLTPELDGYCSIWQPWCSLEQAPDTPHFDSGLQRSGEQRNPVRGASEQPASRSGETAGSRTRPAPSSNPDRPRGRSKARKTCVSDWSTGPPGLLGACFGEMNAAVNGDVIHVPATDRTPVRWEAAGTPGPARLARSHGDCSFSLREHIVHRFMSGSGPAESHLPILACPLDNVRGRGEADAYTPTAMTALLDDVVRLSDAARMEDTEARVPADIDLAELELLLRMLDLPSTLV